MHLKIYWSATVLEQDQSENHLKDDKLKCAPAATYAIFTANIKEYIKKKFVK